MDAKLTTAGDVDLSTGDYILLDGAEAISQHIAIRLKTFLGEWFLDTRIGVPYYEKILGQKPNTAAVRSIFNTAILTTPGVATVSDLQLDFDGATRKLGVVFNGTTTDGEPIVFEEEFILG